MPVTEGSSLHVLPCDAHVGALQKERAPGQRLSSTPVNVLSGLDLLPLLLELSRKTFVGREALRHLGELETDLFQEIVGYCCRISFSFIRWLDSESFPLRGNPNFFTLPAVSCLERLLVLVPNICLDCLQLSRRKTFANQCISKDLLTARVWRNLLVEHGLRVLWGIHLVVAKPAVANDIDNNVSLPSLTPLCCQLEGGRHGSCVVSIDMKDGKVEALSEVRRILRGSVINRICREADLVVDNHMDCATHIKLLNMS
mmetsp:Transcript_150193/g.261683  ORF Transcript_150193/g.261683 Transcript_150193/m.261683 type:complete len:257 (+) Transcript_150193:1158-1928(+)